MDRFGGPNRRLRFLPNRLTLESFEGEIIEARDNPRDAFKDHNADTPWDALHLGYFSSYALWTYLTLPFLYTNRRRVYAYDAKGQKVSEPLLVSIDIEDVSFS